MPKGLFRDPVVEEIRKHSEALAERFDLDLERLCEYYRSRQQTSGHPVVDRASELARARKAPRPRRTRAAAKRISR